MTANELDELLQDRFDMHIPNLIAALNTLPASRPWAASLTANEARLLDEAGFVEDPQACAETAADAVAHMARLYSTAYTAAEVRDGLGVNDSRVRQRRAARTLWAIDDNGRWVYPALQFEVAGAGRGKSLRLRLVRGLDQVLPHLLTEDLHPTAIAGFSTTPQCELRIDNQPTSVRKWLLHGESVDPVLELLELGRWTAV